MSPLLPYGHRSGFSPLSRICSSIFTWGPQSYPWELLANSRLAFDSQILLLPPANEVWAKVVFSQASAILSTTWGRSASREEVSILGGGEVAYRVLCILGGGDLHSGGFASRWGLGSPPPPKTHWVLRDKIKKRVVRILLDCILVDSVSTYRCILNVSVDFCDLAVLAQHPHVFVRTAHEYRFKAVQCRHLHRPAAGDPVVLRQGRPDEHVKIWSEGGAALRGEPVHNPGNHFLLLLPTEGKVMFSEASVSHSVHNQSHGYCVTAHPCYSAVGTHPTEMLSCYERY